MTTLSDFDPRLDALHRRYHASLPAKHAEIESAWRSLRSNCSDIDSLATLTGLIHRLAGSAESYGHAEIGKAAAVVDSLLNRIRTDEGPAEQSNALRSAQGKLFLAMEKLDEAMKSAATRAPGT